MLPNWTVWKSDNQGVKEETFIQTDRRDRDSQSGQGWCAARWQLAYQGCATAAGGLGRLGDSWWTSGTTFMQINQENTGKWYIQHSPGFRMGNWSHKTSGYKTYRGCSSVRNSQCHRTVHGTVPWDPRMYTSPLSMEFAPERAIFLRVAGELTESRPREEEALLIPLRPSPQTAPQDSKVGWPALANA